MKDEVNKLQEEIVDLHKCKQRNGILCRNTWKEQFA
jgi:hypothetical protein